MSGLVNDLHFDWWQCSFCFERSDKMGIFFSTPIVHDPTGRICELSKMVTTAHSYNNCIGEMFEDGVFSMEWVEVWHIWSCAVYGHLPVDQHTLLNNYFWKWMSVFMLHLRHDTERLQFMKDSWQKTGWMMSRVISKETIHLSMAVGDVGIVEMNHIMSGCTITW